MTFLRKHWPLVVLAVLPLAVLWPCVFLGQTIGPWAQVMQMAPWNGSKPSSAWDVLQADGVLQFYPWRDLVFKSWGAGQMPFWNPYQLCGTPLLANSQSAGFYPLHILMGVLHVPTSAAITLLAWFHLAWAGLGARFLARLFGANDVGALFAGASFGLSAFMVSWTPLASVVTTCAWIPWVVSFGFGCATHVESWPKNAAMLAGCMAMMLLGGHLQFAAYGVMGFVVVSSVGLIQAKPGIKAFGSLTAGLVLGGFLAAPQVLPVLEFSKKSHRQSKPTPEGAHAYLASALGAPELSGVAIPGATGLPGVQSDAGGPAYWPAYIKRGAAFSEGALGIGPVAFALLFLFKRNMWKEKIGLAVLSLVGFLLAFGSLSLVLYNFLPGWSSTGSPGRACVLIVLGLSALAGTAVPIEFDKGRVKGMVLGIAVVLCVTLLFWYASQSLQPLPGVVDLPSLMRPGLNWLAIMVPATFLTLLALRKKIGAGVALGIVATLFSGSLFCLPTGRPMPVNAVAEDPNLRRAFVNKDWGLMQAAPAVMPGNTATTARLHDVGGYDSLLDRDTLETLRDINGGQDPAPPANGNIMFVKPGFDLEKLREAGVGEVWSRTDVPGLGEPAEERDGLVVYRLTGSHRAYVATPTGRRAAHILLDGSDRQTVTADGPGVLVVKDRNMDGWTALIDGKSAPIKAGIWREVEIGPGRHEVAFQFVPPGLKSAVLPFIIGVAGMAALVLQTARAHRKRGGAEVPDDPT